MPAVPTKDVLSKNFDNFLSFWDSSLETNNKRGLNDISKSSELIALKIMNAIYGYELEQEKKVNSAGFDLCCTKNQVLVQITSNCTLKKITECLRTTCARIAKEPHLKDFELYILFLTKNRDKTDNLRGKIANIIKNDELGFDISDIAFFPKTHVLDFISLIEEMESRTLTLGQMAQLQAVLDEYLRRIDFDAKPEDRVREVIDLYIDNFEAPLFMHAGSKTVTLKNLYVEPDFTDPKYAASMPALLEDFIWNQGREKILLIEGGAAIGKTSLVSWLCYHHAHPMEDGNVGQTIFHDRPIVVVRLRELEFPNQKPSAAAILHYLQLPGTKAFFDDYPNAILILDGADELGLVSNVKTNAIEDFILDVQQTLKPYKLIVTSRPQFLEASNLKSFLFETRHITLEHFSQSKRAKWVENYKAIGETLNPETEEYILNISDEDADGVADTPLALYLLADCQVQEDYKNNQWALYHAIFSEAITKAPYNTGSSSLLSGEHAAQNYDMVKAIAFRMFRNSGTERFYITKEELDEIAHSIGLTDVDAERVKETCVLCAYWKNINTGALEFYHNNIRDFFLAEYFCDTLAKAFAKLPKVSSEKVENSYFNCQEWQILMEKMSDLFSWSIIVDSTWRKVFTFISLRLLSEVHRLAEHSTLYSRFTEATALLRLMEFFPESTSLWKFKSGIHPYHAAKNAFYNVLVLYHILLDYKRKYQNSTSLISYSRFANTIMSDWLSLFQKNIHFSCVGVAPLTYSMLQKIGWYREFFGNTDFDFSILDDTYFLDCILSHISFCGVTFKNCDIHSTQIRGNTFKYSTLCSSDCTHSDIKDYTNFWGCTFDAFHFNEGTISNSTFDSCFMSDTMFIMTKLQSVVLRNCRIEGMNSRFIHCKFENISTINCTYRNVSPETAETLRSIGFTEDNTPFERTTDYDSESDFI